MNGSLFWKKTQEEFNVKHLSPKRTQRSGKTYTVAMLMPTRKNSWSATFTPMS